MTEQPAAFGMSNAVSYAFAKRERRFVLLRAALAFLLINALIYGASAYLMRDAFADYMAWATQIAESGGLASGTPPPMPPQSVLNAVPAALLLGLLFLVLMAVYEAACLRWLVRGEAGGGLFGLRLDADAARVLLVYLTWVGVVLAVYVALIVVGTALAFLFALVRAPVGLFLALAPLLFLGGLIFVGVRFAPAAAVTIQAQRYAFLRAWAVTKGRFWSLFGAFAFILILYFVASLMLYTVFMFTVMGGAMAALMEAGGRPDPAAIAAMMTTPEAIAASLALNIVFVVLYQLTLIALFGVNAYAASAVQRDGPLPAK